MSQKFVGLEHELVLIICASWLGLKSKSTYSVIYFAPATIAISKFLSQLLVSKSPDDFLLRAAATTTYNWFVAHCPVAIGAVAMPQVNRPQSLPNLLLFGRVSMRQSVNSIII